MTTTIQQIEQTHRIENVEEVISIEGGLVGPRGPKGEPADQTFTRTAAEDISAVHFVAAESDYSVSTVTWSDTGADVIGIATTAATAGNGVTIQSSGEVQDDSFSFIPGRIYVGPNGKPTQTVPGSGDMLQSVGLATATDKFRLTLQVPLIRS